MAGGVSARVRTVGELLAEADRLSDAWAAVCWATLDAEARYRASRDRADLHAWDVALAAADAIADQQRLNSAALRAAVEGHGA